MGRIISVDLWACDINGNRREDLSEYFLSGSVEMNTDRTNSILTGSFRLSEPDRVQQYVDYLQPTLHIDFDDGRPSVSKRLGLYSTRIPPGERTVETHLGTFECQDLTRILSLSAYTQVENVAANTDLIVEIIDTIEDLGISNYQFPAITRLAPKDLTFPIGTTRLEKINALLDIMGWYNLWMDLQGRLTSQPIVPIHQKTPIVTLTPAMLGAPIQDQTNDETLANAVIVIKDDPAEAPLSSTIYNIDPESPTSIQNAPFGTFFRIVTVTEPETQTEINVVAQRYLAESRSFYQTATLVTFPELDFNVHEILKLNLTGKMERLNGNWWIRTWGIGFTPEDAVIRAEINRITDDILGVRI